VAKQNLKQKLEERTTKNTHIASSVETTKSSALVVEKNKKEADDTNSLNVEPEVKRNSSSSNPKEKPAISPSSASTDNQQKSKNAMFGKRKQEFQIIEPKTKQITTASSDKTQEKGTKISPSNIKGKELAPKKTLSVSLTPNKKPDSKTESSHLKTMPATEEPSPLKIKSREEKKFDSIKSTEAETKSDSTAAAESKTEPSVQQKCETAAEASSSSKEQNEEGLTKSTDSPFKAIARECYSEYPPLKEKSKEEARSPTSSSNASSISGTTPQPADKDKTNLICKDGKETPNSATKKVVPNISTVKQTKLDFGGITKEDSKMERDRKEEPRKKKKKSSNENFTSIAEIPTQMLFKTEASDEDASASSREEYDDEEGETSQKFVDEEIVYASEDELSRQEKKLATQIQQKKILKRKQSTK
jgi:hypothetical protein